MYGTPVNFNKSFECSRKISTLLDEMEIPYDVAGVVDGSWSYNFMIAEWLILLIEYPDDPLVIYKVARLRDMQYGVIVLDPDKENEWEAIIRQQYKDGRYDPSKLEV